MFISKRQLRAIGLGVGICCLLLTVLSLFTQRQRVSAPAWIEVAPGPPLQYVDGYQQGPRLSAGAAVLVEANTGTILYAHNEHEVRPMASTTKIMTALVALETTPLNEMVTVSTAAIRVAGSNAGLRAGQQLTMKELLYALLLPSGNDAANVIAEHVGGSHEQFVHQMNEKAADLGATRTRFANAHGLDAPNHHSTAHDLAIITTAALRYPTFSQIVDSTEFVSQSVSNSWRNTNRLLWSYDDIEGVKTGYTGGAGLCLVAASSRSGMKLISVVLAGPDRWQDSVKLLEYGFDEFHLLTLASHGDVLAEVNVPGTARPLRAVIDGDFRVVVRDEQINELNVQVVLDDLQTPVKAGQTVGHLFVTGKDGKLLQRAPLISQTDVSRQTLLGRLWQLVQNLFGSKATGE